MYTSLLLPWSPAHLTTPSETLYRATGHVRTKGTIFLQPPTLSILTETYNAPPRPQSRMSSGAVALCKHFERGGASSEHGRPHPYWTLPRGSNEAKSRTAEDVLRRMLDEVVWRNVMMLHPGVAVYEVRNARGFGMRWTLAVEEEGGGGDEAGKGKDGGEKEGDERAESKNWRVISTAFRGFVEPIEGMDHEHNAT